MARNSSFGSLVRHALTIAIGGLGAVWGIFVLPNSIVADGFRDVEDRLLRFETFSPTTLAQILESQASRDLGACNSHSQRALLLMELPLAQAALRLGAVNEFDKHIQSLESRSRRVLSCTPRNSLAWLLVFGLEVLHGRVDARSFDLLAMSYDTSPNEAWVSVRRIVLATPLVLIAPEPVRQKILFEFQQLIRFGFVDEAVRSYLSCSAPIRELLQSKVEQLDASRQRAFSDGLQRSTLVK